jgi:hypothetical protein
VIFIFFKEKAKEKQIIMTVDVNSDIKVTWQEEKTYAQLL